MSNTLYTKSLLYFAAILPIFGCSSPSESACVEGLELSCSPLYQPVFEEVFTRSIQPGCAVGGSRCHSGDGAQAGLRFDDIEKSYQQLINNELVIAGDASCSLLVKRIEGDGISVMPPGAKLSDAERCSIETWIAEGAKR